MLPGITFILLSYGLVEKQRPLLLKELLGTFRSSLCLVGSGFPSFDQILLPVSPSTVAWWSAFVLSRHSITPLPLEIGLPA